MKKTLLIILFLTSTTIIYAQTTREYPKGPLIICIDTVPINGVYRCVEHEPSPQGSISAFYQYLRKMIQYPEEAKKNNIQGRVFLNFIVEKDGSLSDITIAKGVSPDIDAEAMRVLKNAPKWNPGTHKGLPVRVRYQIQMSFSLEQK